jgi:hypothetical protein
MVFTTSMGIALSTARKTWAHVTIPGDKFKQTTSAFEPFFVEAGNCRPRSKSLRGVPRGRAPR